MTKKTRYFDLSQPEWNIPKKNEEKIYSEFGRLVVESEQISFSIIEMITWFYFHSGMNNKAHAVQIMLNKENHSNLLEIFINSIEYIFDIDPFEKKILQNWKTGIEKVSTYRNNLVHATWASGWLSRSKDWDQAIVFNRKRKKVGTDSKVITQEDILEKRLELKEFQEVIFCIFRCLVTYKKSFKEWFQEENSKIQFKHSKWRKFLDDEYQQAKKLSNDKPKVVVI